jgi:hypothetical protein
LKTKVNIRPTGVFNPSYLYSAKLVVFSRSVANSIYLLETQQIFSLIMRYFIVDYEANLFKITKNGSKNVGWKFLD